MAKVMARVIILNPNPEETLVPSLLLMVVKLGGVEDLELGIQTMPRPLESVVRYTDLNKRTSGVNRAGTRKDAYILSDLTDKR
jgi:hypothetical protein